MEKKGKGLGKGLGKKLGQGGFLGRNKGGSNGPGGFCVCAKCGYKTEHEVGEKCTKLKCPECGTPLIREELLNDKKDNEK